MKPTVGRIVHYVSYGTPDGEYDKECRAAIVTEVPAGDENPRTIGLCVLNPTGMFFNRTNAFHEGEESGITTVLCGDLDYRGGTWHWPEHA